MIIIRSQDKKSLVKVDNLTIKKDEQKGDYSVGTFIDVCNYAPLGWYHTEERALEALGEIQVIIKKSWLGGNDWGISAFTPFYAMPEK